MECIENFHNESRYLINSLSLRSEDDTPLLVIEMQDGDTISLPIEHGSPIVVRFSEEVPGEVELAYGSWNKDCLGAPPAQFQLAPSNKAGGFVVNSRAGGIGVSDIRDTGFRLISIQMQGFPIVFERMDSTVAIKFRNDITRYYISPKIPAFSLAKERA